MQRKIFYAPFLRIHSLRNKNIVPFSSKIPLQCPNNAQFSIAVLTEQYTPSTMELLKALDLQIHHTSMAIHTKSDQLANGNLRIISYRQKLLTQQQLLLQQLEKIISQMLNQEKEMDKILSAINLTSAELLQQFKKSKRQIHHLCQNIEQFNINELAGKHQFFKALRTYLAKRYEIKDKLNFFISTYRAAFYVESCCKSRDMLKFFENYEAPTAVINSDPSKYANVWSKIELVKLPNEKKEGDIEKEYENFKKILYWMGGAVMITDSYQNIFVEQISYIKSLIKISFNYKFGVLKNMQMHYRSRLDKIVKKINIMEAGIFKDILEATCPQIASNFMIYIPHDSSKDGTWNIQQKNESSVPVRVLHHEILEKAGESTKQAIESIIIHVHGGGYVALSSTGTQYSTRSWANETKIPIFSIDYRLAPENPFPQSIQDCFRVYEFIINHIHEHYNINPKNIYVIGDSAGGSISCGLITKILQQGLRIPRGQFLIYPNLDLRKIYYGSRKYLLQEPLLWPSLIKIALEHYLTSKHDFQCQLASPLLLTEQFVGGDAGDMRFPLKWPKTYIHVGSHDALRDQSLLFTQRMVESGVDCKCFVVDKLRHAYLGSQLMTPSAKGIVNHASKMLVELIESTKH